jgi:Protein of unknown function (DUF3015)
MRNEKNRGEKNMLKMSLIAAVVVMAAASSASAKKYGTAGCGLGSLIFHDQKGFIQIVAATTNGTSGNQTFAISTGTLNCSEDGLAMADKEKEFFASANYESLMQEMAQGKGENLQAMASLYGCGTEAFAASVKSNYSRIFPTPETGSNAMLTNLDGVIAGDGALKSSCTEYN